MCIKKVFPKEHFDFYEQPQLLSQFLLFPFLEKALDIFLILVYKILNIINAIMTYCQINVLSIILGFDTRLKQIYKPDQS